MPTGGCPGGRVGCVVAALCVWAVGTVERPAAGQAPGGLDARDALDVVFVGDTCFGETYRAKDKRAWRGRCAADYAACLEHVADLTRGADLVVANLETPLTALRRSPLAGAKPYLHRGHPEHTTQTLLDHGVRLVSLANNHTMDYGADGLRDTLAHLRRTGLAWTGAGIDRASAAEPFVGDFQAGARRVRLVLLAGYEHLYEYDARYKLYASGKRAGVNPWTPATAAAQVRAARQAHPEALVVAFPHWGVNYRRPTRSQRKLAHALVDAGAHLVVGHGPHMVQKVESYGGVWILYSVGNFVFNSPGRFYKEDVPPFGLVARLRVTTQGDAMELALRLYPIFSNNLLTRYRPRPATSAETRICRAAMLGRGRGREQTARRLDSRRDKLGRYLQLKWSRPLPAKALAAQRPTVCSPGAN